MAASADLNDPESATGSTATPGAPGPSGPALAEHDNQRKSSPCDHCDDLLVHGFLLEFRRSYILADEIPCRLLMSE